MAYFYTILYLTILSTCLFAMDRKEATDQKNSDHSYNPNREIREQCTPPNKTAGDPPSYYYKSDSSKKK